MKPVRRQYAFENTAVAHGKQWVLKVRWGWVGRGGQGRGGGCLAARSSTGTLPTRWSLRLTLTGLIHLAALQAVPVGLPWEGDFLIHLGCRPVLPPLIPPLPPHGLAPAQVKYSAAQPALPVGISGETFSAIFGANQSMLEALFLKRRIMGPCWMSVRRPRCVPTEAQVGGVCVCGVCVGGGGGGGVLLWQDRCHCR